MVVQKRRASPLFSGLMLWLAVVNSNCGLAQQEAPAPLNGALHLRTTRQATDWVAAAEAAFASEQKVDFTFWLERLCSQPLLPSAHGAISGPHLAARYSRLMDAGQRSQSTRTLAPALDHAWQNWLTEPTTERLMDYCQRFGDLEPRPRGWLVLGARLRDDGRLEMANLAWGRAAEHSGLTVTQRASLEKGTAEVREQISRRRSPRGTYSQATSPPEQTVSTETAISFSLTPEERPSPLVQWRHPFGVPAALEGAWARWQTEMRSYGASLVPATKPLVLDSQIFHSSPLGLVALQTTHGQEIWSRRHEEWDGQDQAGGTLENLNFRQTFLEQFGRRALADTVLGTMTGDGQRVYVVQRPRSGGIHRHPFQPMPASGAPESGAEPVNSLTALDRGTGKVLWQVGGTSSGRTYAFAETYFCGHPLVVDNLLFVVAQQQGELQCLTLRAETGEFLWKTVLGDVTRAISGDPLRQRVGCTPVLKDGLILCPTAAGAVVAIDPLASSVVWGVRYGMSFSEAASRPRPENTAYLPDPWWDSWREIALVPIAGGMVIASPESDRLHALETETGQLKWSIPRDGGLLLNATPDGDFLVIEPGAVRRHQGTNGRVLWRTEVGEIGGHGVIAGSQFLLPTLTQGIVPIDLATGTKWTGHAGAWVPSTSVSGSLQRLPHGWLMQSVDGLTAFSHSSTDQRRLEEELKKNPANPATLQELTRIDLARGAVEEARHRWNSTHPKDGLSLPLNWEIWKSQLAQSPQNWAQLELSFSTLNLPVQEVPARLLLAQTARDQQDIGSSTRLLLQGLAIAKESEAVWLENPHRRVRADLAVLGELNALLQGPAEQAALVQARCREYWAEAEAARDPFSLQTFSELLKPLALADDFLVLAKDHVFIGQPLAARELRWLKAAGTPSPETALRARERLVKALQQAGFDQDAVAYTKHFQQQGSPAPEPWKSLNVKPAASWPDRLPQVERRQERNDQIHYFPVPMDASSSPLFERLDISIERQGRKVRFAGAGHPGVWEISLPASASSFRYLQQHVAGWGRGRTLILRVGFELFGLLPLDDAGDPAAVVLWHRDMLGGGTIAPDRLRLDILPAIPGIQDEEYRVLDPFGHFVGQVGPVNFETLCYAERGTLVSVDLFTGEWRWTRFDIDPGSFFSGNEEVITLWQPARKEITWLSAIDGRTLGKRSWEVVTEQVIFQSQGKAWWLTTNAPRELICQDLTTGEVDWRTALPTGAAVNVLDGTTLALIDPRGSVQLLKTSTGERIAQMEVEGIPETIDRVISAQDVDRWYLAISEQVPRQAGLQQAQLRNGYRSPFITGPLVAISRQTGLKDWQRQLQQEPFSKDQPRTLPVLSQIYKLPPADLQSGQVTDGLIQLTDKRTGSRVLEHRSADLVGYAAFSADLPQGLVKLQLEHDTLSLWYRPRPPAPELPGRE